MSKPKRAPGNVAKPKGQAMAPEVPEVLPPDGWVKDSPFGFLRYEGGDLARLGDVQAWLEEVKGFDCSQSMAELIKRMPEDVMECLYYINKIGHNGKNQNAQLMPPDSTFSHDGGSLSKPKGRAGLVYRLEYAVRVQRLGMADPMNEPASHAARLAVPMAKARQWWGYGQLAAQQAAPAGADTETGGKLDVSTWAGLVMRRWSEPGADWTDDMLVTIAEEEGRRQSAGEREVRGKMGAELPNPRTPADKGITESAVGKLVRRGLKVIQERYEEAKGKENAATSRNRSVFDLASAPEVTPKEKG